MGVQRGSPHRVIPSAARDRVGVRCHEIFVYILANKTRRLIWNPSLVYLETIVGPAEAIARDNSVNPDWNDLAEHWFADVSRNDPSLRSG